MLPEGIGVLPLFLNIHEGTTDEFKRAVAPYEPKVKELADAGCDLIHPEGAPPFMLLGFKGEADQDQEMGEAVQGAVLHLRQQSRARATRPEGQEDRRRDLFHRQDQRRVRRNISSKPASTCSAWRASTSPFDKVGQLSPEEVYAHVKRAFLKHRKADAIYLLGTGWRVLPVIDLLEQDLGVPVVHPVPARCWEIQHRLSIRQPVPGFGQLLAEMIPG